MEEETAHRAVELAIKTFGTLDILINNVGIGNYKNIIDTSVEDYDEMMDSNMRSTFLFTRYVACRTPEWKLVVAFTPYELSPPSWVPWEGLVSMARLAIGRPHRPRIGLWRLDDDPGEHRDLASVDSVAFRTAYSALLEHCRRRPA